MTRKVKRIELIVPYVEGGGSDRRVRLLARYLSPRIDRDIRVTNVTGAVKGHEAIAKAPPDGLTIGMISNEVGMMHWFGKTDVLPRHFEPLALVFSEPSGLIVGAESGFPTLGSLIEAIRLRPLVGTGSPDYGIWKFGLDGLLQAAEVPPENLMWAPTTSGEEGVELVMAGRADVAPVALAEAAAFLRSGSVKGLATMAPSRHPHFPTVPTVYEAIGLRWELSVWRGFAAPLGIPPDLRDELVAAIRDAVTDPRFVAEAEVSGFSLDPSFGEQFAVLIANEDAKFGPAIARHQAESR